MAERKLYVVFIGLEKAFDRVARKVIWWAFRKKAFWSLQKLQKEYWLLQKLIRILKHL